MTVGLDRPIVVINSGVVDLLDEEELRWILAHELGHAMNGHAVYRTILLRLMNLSGVFLRRSARRPRPADDRRRADGVAAQSDSRPTGQGCSPRRTPQSRTAR
jgi:hypothetical protein